MWLMKKLHLISLSILCFRIYNINGYDNIN
ncbi:protein of unknown function [Citrobacter amalonaticus]|uniref:Uncharacterized protein n=1 Tax=Citrobacter amalonaticus TaxID=35703 RepID=A0AAX2BNN0_CITAM|nr:protein of unknown function [Citrobacter amalonaticus]SBA19001.1 protein of unknown function [Citrobacter amalonaticus]